jgi:hypothetical protein
MFQSSRVVAQRLVTLPELGGAIPAPEAEDRPQTGTARHIALKVYLHEKLLSLLNLITR